MDNSNSSSEKISRVLASSKRISAEDARKFLVDLANTQDHTQDLSHFEKLRGRTFRPEVPLELLRGWMQMDLEGVFDDLSEDEMIRKYWLVDLRNAVQLVWSLPDLRLKQFGVHEILKQFLLKGDRRFQFTRIAESYPDAFTNSLGPQSPMEQVLRELANERSHHLARLCANPKCTSPYFFGKRKSQKYCSEECAEPAQREAKLNWWNKKGKSLRSIRTAAGNQRLAKKSERTAARRGEKERVRHVDVSQPNIQKTLQPEGSL